MYELNLIKDKAKARQRRRIIFLSVVSILFLAGLLAIFTGSLYWRETIVLNRLQQDVATKQASITELTAALNIEEPAARKRRNGLIQAWREDVMVRTDRPYFNPILSDIAQHKPPTADFWYNDITISVNVERGVGGADDEFAAAKALMGTRGLEASGYIQIEGSDVVTESQLTQVAEQMDGMVKLVGKPRFSIEIGGGDQQGQDAEATRYVPFSVRAAQTTFRGGDRQEP